ncbi:MAG: RNA methyltransferase [Gemmatimonadota bacterium]|nr:RNA methyltransferase [Gemmatimonadota bacterium]
MEGTRSAAAALDAGAAVRLALTSPRLLTREDGAGLVDRLAALDADVRHIDDGRLEDLSDTQAPQGILLVCEEPHATLDQLNVGLWLVLDAIQDPGNAGTLVRAAAAFGADGVVALDGTVDPWSPKAVRASAGLVYRVPVVRATLPEFIAHATQAVVEVLVADAGGEDVGGLERKGALALVLGNEGAGIRAQLADAAGRTVAVPMRGPVESLNVGVAGSILLYALSLE